MDLPNSANQALHQLIGLPMWAAGLAGSMAWFQFGARVALKDRKGAERIVGEHALHLSCDWRWATTSGFCRADEESPREAVNALGDSNSRVQSAEVGTAGDVTLVFGDGELLTFNHDSGDGDDDDERWRLFQPGRLTPHFVASSASYAWHEA
jgi:hypothetical protein